MCGSSRRFSYFSAEGNFCRLVLNRLLTFAMDFVAPETQSGFRHTVSTATFRNKIYAKKIKEQDLHA